MKNYRKTSHSVYDLKVHLVWITKYRKPVLFGNVAMRLRDLTREICKSLDVEILKGHVSKDHVHLFVSMPPYLSVSDLVKRVKGKTSWKLMSENRKLSKQFVTSQKVRVPMGIGEELFPESLMVRNGFLASRRIRLSSRSVCILNNEFLKGRDFVGFGETINKVVPEGNAQFPTGFL